MERSLKCFCKLPEGPQLDTKVWSETAESKSKGTSEKELLSFQKTDKNRRLRANVACCNVRLVDHHPLCTASQSSLFPLNPEHFYLPDFFH